MKFFVKKKEQQINTHITAIDGKVIARKGDHVNDDFLNQLINMRPPGISDKRPFAKLELNSHMELLLQNPKYLFISDNGKQKNAILNMLAPLQFNKIVAKEFSWLKRYPYHYHHSLAIGLLVARMMLDFYQDTKKAREAAECAFTHDFGITRVSEEILNKVSPLDKDEIKILHEHPIYSYILLIYYGYDPQDLQTLVGYGHHEDLQGNGYPRAIRQDNMICKCVQLCDIYDALISARPFRPAKTPVQAMQIIEKMVVSGQLDEQPVSMLSMYVGNQVSELS